MPQDKEKAMQFHHTAEGGTPTVRAHARYGSTFRNRVSLRVSAVVVGLLLSFFAPLASGAQALPQAAACKKWELAGTDIYQNNKWTVRFHSGLNGFKGRVESWSWNDPGKSVWGTLASGSVKGKIVKLNIDWDNQAFGVYEGKIDADGYVFGRSWDRFNPSSTATWRAGEPARCVR